MTPSGSLAPVVEALTTFGLYAAIAFHPPALHALGSSARLPRHRRGPINSRNPLTIAPSAQPGLRRDAVTPYLTGSNSSSLGMYPLDPFVCVTMTVGLSRDSRASRRPICVNTSPE